MSTAAAAFSTLILATEPTRPVTIADVVMDHSPDAATMTGLDPAGEVAAEIVMWADADGRAHIDATFADGNYLAIVVDADRRLQTVDSDNLGSAIEQTAIVFDVLAQQDPQAGALMCGAGIIGAGIAIAAGNAPGAFVAGVTIGCNCIPLITGKEIPEC